MSAGALPVPGAEDDASYDSVGKSPGDIERDIAQTRAELGAIVDALERKLAPRELLERGVDMLKDTITGDGNRLGETLRGNPLPLALIGTGIGWLIVSGLGGARLGAHAEALGARIRDTAHAAGDAAAQAQERVQERVEETMSDYVSPPFDATADADYAYARPKSGFAQAASDAASRTRDKVQQAFDTDDETGVAGRVTRFIDDNPLAIGLLGLMAGVAVGLLLPASRIEEEWAGPAGAELRDRAGAFGREAMGRARRVAERTVDAATDAVKQAIDDAEKPRGRDAARQEPPAE